MAIILDPNTQGGGGDFKKIRNRRRYYINGF